VHLAGPPRQEGHKLVAQSGSLPYRRLVVRQRRTCSCDCGLTIRDTEDFQSAPRWFCQDTPAQHGPILPEPAERGLRVWPVASCPPRRCSITPQFAQGKSPAPDPGASGFGRSQPQT